jgi:hypothetical protein
VTVIDFPPYSPDLNPIENLELWSIVQTSAEKHACKSMEDLQDKIAQEWDVVDKDLLRKLARSMPKRCAAVIAAGGAQTKY